MSTRTIRIEPYATNNNNETRLTRFPISSPAVYEIELSGRLNAADVSPNGARGVVRSKAVIVIDNDSHGSFPDQPISEAIIPSELSGARIWAQCIDPGNDFNEEPGIAINIQGKTGVTIQWNCEIRISEATF